ncbi:MAG: DUF488 family protein [Acidobacteria bacterium Pan2503]|uniref:DUF488 family protein n=1 Tax=Candidatus Acidiferrum panamense TaxID=2741543 RepID=A0A7V8SXE7_9BACT|nr:DUF488 family protein [Candidatus Acidoferrum panamensis]
MVRTKRVYEQAKKEDGYRVLVDRLWPRGMKKEAARIDQWMKDVAPSDALRKSFHHDAMKWPDFLKKYQAELEKKEPCLRELKKLEKEHGTLTLLFGARDPEHNQAVVIAEALKKH